MPGFVSVLKLWICKWDFYEDLCVILCFSWKLMPLSFPGDVMHIYQKPNTPTSSPFLKTGMRKLSRWWKKNVFKKQVGVKKKKGVRKEEETLSYSWYQGSAPEKPTINYCWHEAQPFSRRPAGTQQSRASLTTAAPGQQTCSWPDMTLANVVTCLLL